MAPARDSRPRPPRSERGAALLVVMVAIAILTALAVDLAYETRVRLQIAANGRDELRALALAKSGVNLGRMVLAWQAQLDEAASAACKATGAVAPGTPPPPCPRVQIWSLFPVTSGLVGALFEGGAAAGAGPEGEEGAAAAAVALGGYQGGFEAKLDDEGTKVNVQLDELGTSGLVGPKVEALLRLVCEARWDGLFDREDANGQRYSRADLGVMLRDWVDEDAASSASLVAFQAGNCGFTVPPNPFEPGFGDENFPYERGSSEQRYRTKNARLDSLDELYLVAGIGDAFMAAFGDRLTVYQPRDKGINVNTLDPARQLQLAGMMADAASLAVVADPEFGGRLSRSLAELSLAGLMTISPTQFVGVLEMLGVTVKSEFRTANPKNPFTDRSFAFRIRAEGGANDVRKRIDAVVTFDPAQNAGAQPGQPSSGRLIRWREE